MIPSRGRSGVTRFFLGSVTEKLLRLAHCQVLVLRVSEDSSDSSLRKVLTSGLAASARKDFAQGPNDDSAHKRECAREKCHRQRLSG